MVVTTHLPVKPSYFFPLCFAVLWLIGTALSSAHADFARTIAKIKPSIVGIGTLERTRRPPVQLLGTGFVVGNGYYIITNAHVIPEILDEERREELMVFSGSGKQSKMHPAKVVSQDKVHDLTLLKIGTKLPAMRLGSEDSVREGEEYLFTGFPIGAVLGLYPVTHKAMVSAVSPVAEPVPSGNQLDVRMIRALRDPFFVYQLDGTAYPGNSGSPLYNGKDGRVVAVINKVFVQETKERVIQEPSGISYAIPVVHVRNLMTRAGVAF